jgi:hypothetical protein
MIRAETHDLLLPAHPTSMTNDPAETHEPFLPAHPASMINGPAARLTTFFCPLIPLA